ncbi:MAG: TonB-dependent receptor, partial [Saprospiraceae bacterium]|nr:TonB-dependent receptor [Saprospiraceae bacterium]
MKRCSAIFSTDARVSAANENSSGLYVRGGTPDQTLVLYDGFNVYHVSICLGSFPHSIPMPSKMSNCTKAALNQSLRKDLLCCRDHEARGAMPNILTWGINAGLLAANATAEIPIGDKMTTLFAFRRSYQSGLYNKIFNKYGASTNQVIPG